MMLIMLNAGSRVMMRTLAILAAVLLLSGAVAAKPAGPTEKNIQVTPAQGYDYTIRTDGKPAIVWVQMFSGVSREATLTGACGKQTLSFNIIGGSTSGQTLAYVKCPALKPGAHQIHLDSGVSAFGGRIKLINATF